jgi:hypothetical protein
MGFNAYGKSRQKLCDAFTIILTVSNTLNQITVKRLTELAEINRITFYRQFDDLNDFIKWFVLKDFLFSDETLQPLHLEIVFTNIFGNIALHRSIYQKITTSNYGPFIQSVIHQEILRHLLNSFFRIDRLQTVNEVEINMQSQFYAAGITGLIFQYINDEKAQEVPVDQYVTYALRLVKGYIERAIDRSKRGQYDGIHPKG